MKYPWIDEYLMTKPAVTRDLQKDWNWIRYQPYYITMKLDPLEGEALRQQYEDILPGYYMNKLHWNSVRPDGAVPEELMRHILDQAYTLVLHSLSREKQAELLG